MSRNTRCGLTSVREAEECGPSESCAGKLLELSSLLWWYDWNLVLFSRLGPKRF